MYQNEEADDDTTEKFEKMLDKTASAGYNKEADFGGAEII